MSTTSMAIFSNPLFATYSVYARNASITSEAAAAITHRCWQVSVSYRPILHTGFVSRFF